MKENTKLSKLSPLEMRHLLEGKHKAYIYDLFVPKLILETALNLSKKVPVPNLIS